MWVRGEEDEEQVANANEGFVDLTPVSDAALQTMKNWAATQPGTDPVPLIWED